MTLFRAALLLALPLQAAVAQVTPAGSPRGAEASRDHDLERRVEARRAELARFVRMGVWKRVEGASRGIEERIRSGHPGDLVDYTRKQVAVRIGKLKPMQTDLLAFCILAQTARTLSQPVAMDSALVVTSEVDTLQAAAVRDALHRESALMSAARLMLEWTEREKPEILLTVK